MIPINWEEIIPLSVSSYGGDRPVFSVSIHHLFSHFVCHVPIYLGMNSLAKKEYKLPIVKQLVGMWQQCSLLHFAYRAIGVECGIFPV